MFEHRHKATVFEQEQLRLPNGNYHPDAPARLHKFWLQLGLYMELETTAVGDQMIVKHMLCVEDVS